MPEKLNPQEHQFSTEELLRKAVQSQLGSDIYSNFAQVTMTQNEMLLDLFTLSPVPGKQETPKMVHIQRVIFPLHLAPGLISAIQSSWQAYQEKDMPIKIVQFDKEKE